MFLDFKLVWEIPVKAVADPAKRTLVIKEAIIFTKDAYFLSFFYKKIL